MRAEAMKHESGGLRAVYRTLEVPGKHPLKDAHAALDAAVLAAYGFDAKQDLLAQPLELNLTVDRRRAGKAEQESHRPRRPAELRGRGEARLGRLHPPLRNVPDAERLD